MRTRNSTLVLLVSFAFVLRAEEFGVGVWKLNPGRSTPAPDPPQSQIFTVTAEDGMMVTVEDVVTAKGVRYQVTSKLALDGKDYPVVGSRAGIESVSGRRVDANWIEVRAKRKDGAVAATYWGVISADGRTRIRLTWFGPEVSGPPARLSVDEKQ